MEVSGVRSAWVTASSRAVRSCSPWRAASVWPSCSTARACSMAMAMSVPIASTVCRGRIVPEVPSVPIARTPSRTGRKQRPFGTSNHGLRADHDRLEALGVELRSDRAGAVDFLLLGEEERRRSHLEHVHDLGGNPVEQLHHVAGFEQPLAESVEPLDIALARGSIRGLLPGARRKAAGKNGDHEKRDQGDPILRIGDRNLAHRREEKEVEREAWPRPTWRPKRPCPKWWKRLEWRAET